jgi:hypothetical protein
MSAPLIVLPLQFKGTTLSAVPADVVRRVDEEGRWPAEEPEPLDDEERRTRMSWPGGDHPAVRVGLIVQ